jgi:hypothetical protein
MGDKGKKKEKPVETFTSGLVFTVVFGALLGWHGAWWWIFPLAFAGVLPMVKGITSMVFQRQRLAGPMPPPQMEGPSTSPLPKADSERQILLVAKEEGGRVTPALAALKTELSIENAEQILQDMAEKGYATMHVTDEGRVEYRFPEFGEAT